MAGMDVLFCLCSATSENTTTAKHGREAVAVGRQGEQGYRARYGYSLIGLSGQTLAAAAVDLLGVVEPPASYICAAQEHRHSPVPVLAGTMIVKTTTENATLVGCSVQPDSTALLHAGGEGPHLLFIALGGMIPLAQNRNSPSAVRCSTDGTRYRSEHALPAIACAITSRQAPPVRGPLSRLSPAAPASTGWLDMHGRLVSDGPYGSGLGRSQPSSKTWQQTVP